KPDAAHYLTQLRSVAEDILPAAASWIAHFPSYSGPPVPTRDVTKETPRTVLGAIRNNLAIEIKYQSLSRPEPRWRWIAPHDVLILTPFRAQRTLIRSFLKRRHPTISVSTVHRAQGSERKVIIFDPVDATSSFLRGKEGDRLINVAISRAQAHVIIPYHASELTNPTISRLQHISSGIFQTSGRYMRPFSFATAG